MWIARASACGTSCARGGSKLHLTNGWTTRVASRFVRFACMVMWARTCWPAVTTSGEWFAWALKIAPIPLPTPGAVCRLTWVGRPEAWAKPSAIPTATASCRPSTYWKSSGNSASIGSSVDPGLPKIVVIPCSRKSSKLTSRTLAIAAGAYIAYSVAPISASAWALSRYQSALITRPSTTVKIPTISLNSKSRPLPLPVPR
jgi:hypothetical protein